MNQMARRKQRYQEIEYYSLSPETKKGVLIIFFFLVAIVSILSFLGLAGKAGIYIDWGLGIALGWGRFILPIILIGLGYVLARPNHYQISVPNYFGIFLFFLSAHGLVHLQIPFQNSFELSFSGLGGGIVGYLVSYPILLYLGAWAGAIILIGILLASVLLIFNTSIENVLGKTNIFRYLPMPFKRTLPEDGGQAEEDEGTAGESTEEETPEEPADDKPTKAEDVKFFAKKILSESSPEKQPSIRVSKIKIDLPMNLLDDKLSKPTSGDIKMGTERIQKTLANFHINVEMGEVQVGPTVTQYTLKPAEGIKLSRITALNNDLALALAAHPIRIEAPIPGKSFVGIEVPNQKPAIVRVREILTATSFKERKTTLTIALGKDVSGKCWVDDLSGMPHLLVAGATGSGKSVCLNAIIMSLLYQNNPDTLRFIMIDPKRVEFPVYNGIPHLLTPVITDVTKTVYALRWAIGEMDSRFDTLAQAKKRNISSYNLTAKDKMPYIVIIIDELADLMVAAAAEVEACIIRLTQMARAIGIHLVVATQRPSVDVITGLIKANIPCRIAFSVASLMDSRTILDSSGAEKLVGKGDMLFMTPQTAKPRRLQGAYVSDNEIKRVVDFLRNAAGEAPQYQEEILEKPRHAATSFDFNGGDDDSLFDEARDLVVRSGKASASLLQRRLRIGYARAARLIDLMEDAGIVGPAEGAKPREILIDKVSALTKSGRAADDDFEEIDEPADEPDDLPDDEEAEDNNDSDDEKNNQTKNNDTTEDKQPLESEEESLIEKEEPEALDDEFEPAEEEAADNENANDEVAIEDEEAESEAPAEKPRKNNSRGEEEIY